MGKDRNELEHKTGVLARRQKPSKSPVLYASYHPNKDEKDELSDNSYTLDEFADVLQTAINDGLIIRLKPALGSIGLTLECRENVPFGSPCRVYSFTHGVAALAVAGFVRAFHSHAKPFLDGSGTPEQLELADW